MDEGPVDNKPKPPAGINVTSKHLGVGGGLIAAIALVTQMKGMFVPVEKGDSLLMQIQAVQVSVATMREEFSRKLERNTDKIIDRINQTEERTSRNSDTQTRRIDSLEAYLRIRPQKVN